MLFGNAIPSKLSTILLSILLYLSILIVNLAVILMINSTFNAIGAIISYHSFSYLFGILIHHVLFLINNIAFT